MRLLVTGGLGFIGSHFVRYALTRSDVTSVAVLDSMTYAADLSRLEGLDGDFELIVGSIADPEVVDRAVSRVDAVVNFAAESHNDNSLKGPRVFYDTNVTGLLVLADACVRNEVRLHHVSTDEVFGDMPFESSEKFTRLSRLNPSSPYSASKAAGDLALHAWARSFGLAYTISNCSNNFGSGQHAEKLIPTIFRHLSQGKPAPIYGSGTNIRDWIHVSDHVTGIFAAITTGKLGETYLLGASDEVANIDLALKIGDFFGLGPSDSVSFVTDRPGHDRRYAIDWEHSGSELGWKPTHPKLLESIPELARYYSAN